MSARRMNQTSPIDEAIARCDVLLENIDRIQRDMREATAKTISALDDAIAKLKQPVK